MCKNERGEIVPYMKTDRKFLDGSIYADIPLLKLRELFNTTNLFFS